MIAFVAGCAGGVDALYLQGLVDFHRLVVNPDLRRVSGLFFQHVADSLASAPHFAMAVVKAQYTCPKEKVSRHKECGWITSHDLASAKSKGDELRKVEDTLREVHTLVSAELVEKNVKVEALAKLDTRVARFSLGKQDRSQAPAKSVAQVVVEVLRAFAAKAPASESRVKVLLDKYTPLSTADPPSGSQTQGPSGSQTQGPALRLIEFEDGEAEAIVQLRAHGFEVGAVVCDIKKPSGKWKISETTQKEVTLRPFSTSSDDTSKASAGTSSAEGRVLPVDDFLKSYRLGGEGQRVAHPGWPSRCPLETEAYQLHVARAMVNLAFARVSMLLGNMSDKITIWDKPRSVRAKVGLYPKAVKLVPEGFKVSARRSGEAVPAGDVEVIFDSGSPLSEEARAKTKFYITPAFSDSFVSPFGAVGHTSVPSGANMMWEFAVVHDIMVVTFPGEKPSAQKPSSGCEFTIRVPVLVNRCRLCTDDELVMHRLDPKRKEVPIVMSKVVGKRARSNA